MRGCACRIAHVVQAVEEGNEIKVPVWVVLSCANLKPGVSRDPVFPGMGPGMLDRARMKVVTDKLRVRIRLCHDHGGHAVAASDIGNPCAALQLGDDAIE